MELSTATLSPHGIEVIQIFDDYNLPFPNETFDLIINRHEFFSAEEVYRLLKPKGVFITQQVGGKNNKELSKYLLGNYPDTITMDFNLESTLKEVKSSGLKIIEAEEHFPHSRFYDIGALVYFAKIIQWEFPGFSVEKSLEPLLKLQQDLEEKGYVESIEHRFFIVAIKE